MGRQQNDRRGLAAVLQAVPAERIMAVAAAVAAVLYLSVTLRATLYGDDCSNNLFWYYRLTHEGLWALLQQEVQGILNGLRGRMGRFFPFFLPPQAFTAVFKGSITAYRLYIIAYTLADAAGLGVLLARTLRGKNGGLAYFALLPLMLCLWCQSGSNALYSYEALPQAALGAALLAAHCMVSWGRSRRWYWACLAALFTFISCGTYEIGYTFLLAWGFWALLLHDRFWDAVCTGLPLLGGEAAALFFYRLNRAGAAGVYEGTSLSLVPDKILLTTLQQMSGSFPLNEPLAAGAPWPQQWSAGDLVWPLVLALVGVAAVYRSRIVLTARQTVLLVLAGLTLLGAPALLIGMTVKYQDPEWVSWEYAYIPAAVGSFGVALFLWVALVWLFRLLQKRGGGHRLCLAAAAVLVVLLTGGSAWQRAATRERYPASERHDRALLEAGVAAGLTDPAGSTDPVLCDFDVWGSSVEAQQMFFRRYGEREVNALPFMVWSQQMPQTADNVYRMGEYAGYGGYTTVWFGQALPGVTDTVCRPQVYVDGGTIPDTAVLKYYHREADGSETHCEIPLADLPRTARDNKGRYIVTIDDAAVCVPKIMIWAQ